MYQHRNIPYALFSRTCSWCNIFVGLIGFNPRRDELFFLYYTSLYTLFFVITFVWDSTDAPLQHNELIVLPSMTLPVWHLITEVSFAATSRLTSSSLEHFLDSDKNRILYFSLIPTKNSDSAFDNRVLAPVSQILYRRDVYHLLHYSHFMQMDAETSQTPVRKHQNWIPPQSVVKITATKMLKPDKRQKWTLLEAATFFAIITLFYRIPTL